MKITIDKARRVAIVKEIRRDEANLTPGVLLDVRWRDGRIEPAPAPVSLQRRGRLLVAVPGA